MSNPSNPSKVSKATRWGVLSLTATLGACASLPATLSEPELPTAIPERFSESLEGVVSSAQGWQALGDPVLPDLIRQGLQGNLALAQAVKRVEQSRALVRAAAGQRWPAADIRLGATSQQLARVDAPLASSGDRRVDSIQLQTAISWELDLAGRLKHRLDAQQLRLDARHADAAALRLSVAAEIASAWYAYEGIRARMEIIKSVLDNRERALQLVRTRVSAGASASIDETRAQAELAQARSALPRWEGDLKVQANRIAVLLGKVPGAYQPPIAPRVMPHLSTLRLPTVTQWVSQRPDLLAARLGLAAHASDLRALEADLLPRIELGGVLGFVAGSLGTLGSGGSLAWALTPSISMPLFNREGLLARTDESRSRGREAALAYRENLLSGLAEVESAVAQYRLGQQSLHELEQRLAYAQRAHRIAELRWRGGATEMLEWLDAQRQAYAAALEAADAVTLQRQHAIQLFKALGQQPDA